MNDNYFLVETDNCCNKFKTIESARELVSFFSDTPYPINIKIWQVNSGNKILINNLGNDLYLAPLDVILQYILTGEY